MFHFYFELLLFKCTPEYHERVGMGRVACSYLIFRDNAESHLCPVLNLERILIGAGHADVFRIIDSDLPGIV